MFRGRAAGFGLQRLHAHGVPGRGSAANLSRVTSQGVGQGCGGRGLRMVDLSGDHSPVPLQREQYRLAWGSQELEFPDVLLPGECLDEGVRWLRCFSGIMRI